MTQTGRRVALITGASTGIGLATAKHLIESGYFVILTARRSSLGRLEALPFLKDKSTHWLRPFDVRSGIERKDLVAEVDRELGRLDALINNAGVVYRTPIEYAYEFESKEQMLVNFHAPVEMIKACLPLMRKSGGSRIINVSSAAGFFAVPTMGLYAASKHALEGASEALHYELRPWNIHVTLIEPGFVASEAYLNCRLGLAFDRHASATENQYRMQTRVISSLVDRAIRYTTSSPEAVAKAIGRTLVSRRPPLRKPVTLDAQLFLFLKKFMPEYLFECLIEACLKRIQSGIEYGELESGADAPL